MGCNCGFGNGNGGGGGGGGNLSGTLTAPQFPSATGPNTLADSQLSDRGDFILMEGNIHTQNEGNNYYSAYVAGTSGERFQFQFSRGTLLAPDDVVATDVLGRVDFLGLATSYAMAAYIQAIVADAVSAGIVPGGLDFHVADEVGADTRVLLMEAEQTNMYGNWKINGTTARNLVDLSALAGVVAVPIDLADWFALELNSNVTLDAPSGFFINGKNRYFQLRVRQAGLGGFTMAFNGTYKFPNGVPVVLSTAPGAYDVLSFQYNEPEDWWMYVGGSFNIS